MIAMRERAISYLQQLPDEKLNIAISYLQFLYEQKTPLDEYDYELARLADENMDGETVPFEEALKDCGLKYEDL